MQEVKDNLIELLSEDLLKNVPLLVFANKQDLEMALDASEVSASVRGSHFFFVRETGDGAPRLEFDHGPPLEHSGLLRHPGGRSQPWHRVAHQNHQ